MKLASTILVTAMLAAGPFWLACSASAVPISMGLGLKTPRVQTSRPCARSLLVASVAWAVLREAVMSAPVAGPVQAGQVGLAGGAPVTAWRLARWLAARSQPRNPGTLMAATTMALAIMDMMPSRRPTTTGTPATEPLQAVPIYRTATMSVARSPATGRAGTMQKVGKLIPVR